MPAKHLATPEQFLQFSQAMEERGFRAITDPEMYRNWRRLRLRAPREREGKETGFCFSANGYTVVVWTTWLAEEDRMRDTDAGWVLIVGGDDILYSSHPVHRTKHYLARLLLFARIARWRILHRPLCGECEDFMDIARGRGVKSRYWICRNAARHSSRRPVCRDWDSAVHFPLPARKFLEAQRKKRAKYRASRRREGKQTQTAISRRKSWKDASRRP